MNEIYLIGLGNPGKKYSQSRHNIGFLLLENLANKYNSNFLLKEKLKSSCSEFKINESTYRLFLPNTFMNNSGDAVRAIIDWYKINFRSNLLKNPVIVMIGYKFVEESLEKQEVVNR